MGQVRVLGGLSLLVALRRSSKQVSHIEGICFVVRWMGGVGADGRCMGICGCLDEYGGFRVVE